MKHIELPAPTPWPMAFGLSIALLFAGVVTTPYVSMVGGVLFLTAAVGWWRQVLPAERHEQVEVRGEVTEPAFIPRGEVERIRVGQAGHRVRRISRTRPFSAALRGGIVGAIGMAAVACLFGLLSQGSIWYPINLLAAAAIPDLAAASVEQLRQFSMSGLVLGTLIHGTTSLLVGLLYAVMLPMFPRGAFWWAGLTAPVLWTALSAAGMELVNPALNARIDWRWFIASQLAWGLTGGFVIARTESIETLEDLPLAVRAGIETPGVDLHL